MEQNIGRLIYELRRGKKLTLKQISEKTGLSISFISQVERSKSSITIESLTKIAEALNVSPSYFFTDKNKEKNFVHRRVKDAASIQTSQFIYESITGDVNNPVFEPMIVTLLPRNQKVTTFTHSGQEFLYVIEGILTVLYDEDEYELHPGDSFHVESTNPHNWYNRTDKLVKILYVRSSVT